MVKHVKLLVIEAMGVVGIFIPDCINEEERHNRQTNIKNGAAPLIFYYRLRKLFIILIMYERWSKELSTSDVIRMLVLSLLL